MTGAGRRRRGRLRQTVRKVWRALREVEPEIWRNLHVELTVGRQWLDRVVVLTYAVAAGGLVVAFTFLAEMATHAFGLLQRVHAHGLYAALVLTPALAAAGAWYTRRFAPGAAGSGIPQVMRALDDDLTKRQLSGLVSWRIALHKIVGVCAALLGGMSVGREGPTVQIGAGIMVHARRWLSPDSQIDAHDLMVAGAAAGIAAAFNTPLGGIVFAMEKLSRRRGATQHAVVIAAIVLSGLVAVSVFGNETYFGRLKVQELSWSMLGPGALIVLIAGLSGGLFSRLTIVSMAGAPDRFSRWRRAHPIRFAAACGFGVALMVVATGGATAGAGYAQTRALLEGHTELPGVYTLLKFCATWLSSWSGVPAGVFAPSLSIGAGIGRDVSLAVGVDTVHMIPLIAIGMVAFLAASTQGPITAFIIVMEMVSGQSMVLSLMAAALLANGVSRLISKPMYQEMAKLLPVPGTPTATAPPPATPAPGPPAPPQAS